jgi:hypothetical protein
MWNMYIYEHMLRYSLKIMMCAIDIMKPLVFSLLCGYSNLFNNPILEPIQTGIRLKRSRLIGIKVNDILTTTQFI